MSSATSNASITLVMPDFDDRPARCVWPGELNADTCHGLRELLAVLIKRQPVVVDLRGCAYLSEEGVMVLLGAWHQARRRGWCLRVVADGQPLDKLQTCGRGIPGWVVD